MFSKSFVASALLLVAGLTSQVNAHCAVVPALGVAGTPKRSDVQRPSKNTPCGSINVAKTLDTSTAVTAAADGTFTVTATNFNAGADGSRQVTAQVDPTGKGTTFVAATVTTNGDKAPTNVDSQPIVVKLPGGTKCTGGAAGDLCLASFTTSAGFGNCVVVKQAGASTGAAAGGNKAVAVSAVESTTSVAAASTSTTAALTTATTTAAANTDNTTAAAAGATGTKTTGKHHHHHHHHQKQKPAAQKNRMIRRSRLWAQDLE